MPLGLYTANTRTRSSTTRPPIECTSVPGRARGWAPDVVSSARSRTVRRSIRNTAVAASELDDDPVMAQETPRRDQRVEDADRYGSECQRHDHVSDRQVHADVGRRNPFARLLRSCPRGPGPSTPGGHRTSRRPWRRVRSERASAPRPGHSSTAAGAAERNGMACGVPARPVLPQASGCEHRGDQHDREAGDRQHEQSVPAQSARRTGRAWLIGQADVADVTAVERLVSVTLAGLRPSRSRGPRRR